VVEEDIHQRPGFPVFGGMHAEAGGFVHGQKMIIFVQSLQIAGFRRHAGGFGRGQPDPDAVAGLHFFLGAQNRPAVEPDRALFSQLLDPGAGEGSGFELHRQVFIDADRRLGGRHGEGQFTIGHGENFQLHRNRS